MKAAILGLGKIGHNTAAMLADRGFEVAGFTRDEKKAQAVNEYGITVSGSLNGNFRVTASTDIQTVVSGAGLLVVTTTSVGHKPMAQRLKGLLEEGQRIVILTGNWGAYEFYSILKDEVIQKHVVIGETSGNLAASPTLDYPAATFMKPIKKRMSFAAIPGSAGPAVVQELRQAFPEFYAVKNILDTSFNNPNPPIHVPFCLFNITRMANGEDAQFYGECLPPILMDFVMAADAERCDVAKAAGGTGKSILTLLNESWGVHYDTIKDLGLNNPSLQSVKLPKTPYHRFLTEDVPYGYMPISCLGKKYHVPTPRIDLMIDAYRYLLGDHAQLTGPEFTLDLSEVL